MGNQASREAAPARTTPSIGRFGGRLSSHHKDIPAVVLPLQANLNPSAATALFKLRQETTLQPGHSSDNALSPKGQRAHVAQSRGHLPWHRYSTEWGCMYGRTTNELPSSIVGLHTLHFRSTSPLPWQQPYMQRASRAGANRHCLGGRMHQYSQSLALALRRSPTDPPTGWQRPHPAWHSGNSTERLSKNLCRRQKLPLQVGPYRRLLELRASGGGWPASLTPPPPAP